MAVQPLKAVFEWVLRTMMKAKGETGIVQTMPKKDIVEMNTQITAQRLMQNGIDPTQLKNADQVENVINQIEKSNIQVISQGDPRFQGIMDQLMGGKKSAKVFDMEGKEIPKGSKIMGGKEVKETDAQIKARLDKDNKEGIARIRESQARERQKMIENSIDNQSPGFSGDRKVDAVLVAEEMAERMGKVYDDLPIKEQTKLYGEAFDALSKRKFDLPEDMAQGGIARLGLKEGSGMTRRTFLKLLGGMAAVPIVGKFFKLAKVGKTMKEVPMIKTDDVAGKPEWFDALVNKVIREGDDVTKTFATGERQSIHQKRLNDGSVVRVTEDVDQGAVRVEYESKQNVFGDTATMEYKKPLPDEGAPSPTAEFTTAESGPVGRRLGPDDFEIDVDEVGGTSIRDLDSDVSKLKEYATGQKPTMKEIVEIKKRKDKAKAITEGGDEMIDAVTRRQGDYVPEPDDFASGGIARLLGE